MIEDFPAAHSMDTEWFAVDSVGHVARFASGEPGAVPNAAKCDLSGVLMTMLFECGLGFDVEDLLETAADRQFRFIDRSVPWTETISKLTAAETATPFDCVLWFEPECETLDTLADCPSNRTEAGLFVYFDTGSAEHVTLLSKHSAFRNGWVGLLIEQPPRLGVYDFQHDDLLYPCGPYQCFGVPRHPIHASELSDSARDAIQAVELPDVVFARDGLIQPMELVAASRWGSCPWYDTLGRFHADD